MRMIEKRPEKDETYVQKMSITTTIAINGNSPQVRLVYPMFRKNKCFTLVSLIIFFRFYLIKTYQ